MMAEQFSALLGAYDYFNKQLFKGKLPSVILNLSRKNQAAGFVAPFQWRSAKKKQRIKVRTMNCLSIQKYYLCPLNMYMEYWYMNRYIYGRKILVNVLAHFHILDLWIAGIANHDSLINVDVHMD